MNNLINTPILESSTLILPEALHAEFPLDAKACEFIAEARASIVNILKLKDKRLLVIVGPCSIHDEMAAREYYQRLHTAAQRYCNDLFIVMRTYFEKPRTVIGWKGWISDPFLDGSCQINHGLVSARKLLIEMARQKIPTATEFLDTIIPHYISDLISWTAVGARTSESQLHRELASGLSMPVGFKNSTDGNINIAIDAVKSAQHSHHFLGISALGQPCIFHTSGNPNCHVVLRGGTQGSNYSAKIIHDAASKLKSENLCSSIVVDCSHGNSQKNYLLQLEVAAYCVEQIRTGNNAIRGVMLESNLVAGKQELQPNKKLVYGQSITDACISWEQTETVLKTLALAVAHKNKIKVAVTAD